MGCLASTAKDEPGNNLSTIQRSFESSYRTYSGVSEASASGYYEEPIMSAVTFDRLPDSNANSSSDLLESNHFYENFGNVRCTKCRKDVCKSAGGVSSDGQRSSERDAKVGSIAVNPKYGEVDMADSGCHHQWPLRSPSAYSKMRPSISEPFLLREGLLSHLPATIDQHDVRDLVSSLRVQSHYVNVFEPEEDKPEKGSVEAEDSKDEYVEMQTAVPVQDTYEDMYITVTSREDVDKAGNDDDDDGENADGNKGDGYSYVCEWTGKPAVGSNHYYNVVRAAGKSVPSTSSSVARRLTKSEEHYSNCVTSQSLNSTRTTLSTST